MSKKSNLFQEVGGSVFSEPLFYPTLGNCTTLQAPSAGLSGSVVSEEKARLNLRSKSKLHAKPRLLVSGRQREGLAKFGSYLASRASRVLVAFLPSMIHHTWQAMHRGTSDTKSSIFLLGNIPDPLTRPRILRIVRPAACGRAHSLRCSSFPHTIHFVGVVQGPLCGCATFRRLIVDSIVFGHFESTLSNS